jgi:type III pantothenate kinase
MTPHLVVDVGNTRIKWGLCSACGIRATAALPPDAPDAWHEQLQRWNLTGSLVWAVTGVHPGRQDGLLRWLQARGDTGHMLDAEHLPLRVLVEHPRKVGIDRLLDAVAANSRRRPGAPAVVIDAGSAVTVDWLDEAGAFRGGAIFPGLRLMARALHEHTALLPLVEVPQGIPPLPGTATAPAITAGIFWAVVGGIQALTAQLGAGSAGHPDVFLTGGDAALLHQALPATLLWPDMTLEGIRLAALALRPSPLG